MRAVSIAIALCIPTTAAIAQASGQSKTDIPVKSVMLFSSGVGYFEHGGTVRGDGSAELRFKATQINDILKSLVLQDRDGGRVTAITYPSQDPVEKTLRSFQVDITNNPSIANLLNQLRGARITVQLAAERVTGTILGVETRRKPVEKGEPTEIPMLNLLTGTAIRSIELPAVSSFSLDDAQLQGELSKALEALSQARDQDKKPVTITFTGTGERRVRIGYVVETPIWKTSYRLLLDDKASRLQGWAIVENQTESDWNNVALSLVSGRPISFIMDLYQPLYLQRPTVIPELFAGLQPQLYFSGRGVSGGTAMGLVPRDEVTTKQTVATNGFEEASVTTGQSSATFGNAQAGIVDIFASVRNVARAAQLGELFQYAIPNVTLARQTSAMLPIVTDTVGIERLSIYNASVLPRNPLNGVRLKNTTGKHLLQGPVTVLEKNAYAGDARIDDVPPGQERLLSYGVDLEMLVDNTRFTDSASVITAQINKGVLLLDRKAVTSRDYQVDNKGSRDKMLVIEHPVRFGWKLTDSSSLAETTPDVYRFQATIPAGKQRVIQVREQRVQQQTIALIPTNADQLLVYSRAGEMPGAVRDGLIKAAQLKQGLNEIQRQIDDRTTQVNAITQEQARIRENMKAVDQKTAYYGRLLSKLNEQESKIEQLQKERDDLQAKLETQRDALADYLGKLTVK